MTKAVAEISEYGFKTFDINRIFARVYGNNPASMRVMEKLGFEQEVFIEKTIYKRGEFLDEYIFAKRKA